MAVLSKNGHEICQMTKESPTAAGKRRRTLSFRSNGWILAKDQWSTGEPFAGGEWRRLLRVGSPATKQSIHQAIDGYLKKGYTILDAASLGP